MCGYVLKILHFTGLLKLQHYFHYFSIKNISVLICYGKCSQYLPIQLYFNYLYLAIYLSKHTVGRFSFNAIIEYSNM